MAKEVARLDLNPLIHDAVANQIDINKFNGIEDGATADQTASEIESLYEGLDNTNKYTDSDKSLVASALQSETVTSLSIDSNVLTYTDEKGNSTDIDLSLYLDDTNLARLTSGSLDANTGIATFKRDDNSTFTIDMSAFFDDTQVTVTDSLDSTSTTEALSANQGKIVNDALTNHKNDISNPHNVTQAQVGLSNVDNTADVNKPISTATQNALNLKRDITDSYSKTDLDNGQLDNRYYTEAEVLGAIGNINSPLLDLPLQNSLSMKAGVGSVTFTRSTTATYIDRYGVLKTAAVDESRFEKDGLLIEGSSTNSLLYSDDLTDASWIKSYITISSNTDATTDPFLTNLANKVISDTTNVHGFLKQSYTTSDNNATVTVSCFVKQDDAYGIAIADSGVSKGNSWLFATEEDSGKNPVAGWVRFASEIQSVKLANGWYRLSITFIQPTAGTYTVRFGNTDETGSAYKYGDGTVGNFFFGMQIETLPFVSSYIPTTDSAVTRATDFAYSDNVGQIPDVSKPFSIYTEHTYLGTDNIAVVDQFNAIQTPDGSTNAFYFRCETANNRYIAAFSNNGFSAVGGALVYGETTKLCATYDGLATLKLYVNGSLVSTVTNIDNSLIIGGKSSRFKLNGWGKNTANSATGLSARNNTKLYDFELTATEVALLG